MKKFLFFFIAILLSLQTHSQSTKQNLLDINSQVWMPFCEAFNSLEHELFRRIHSDNMIRISGNKKEISEYGGYMIKNKNWFASTKSNGNTIYVSLRFFERINSDTLASERGIYQTITNKGTENEKTFYGQFHVLLIKENTHWKILMDYDSNERSTIDEKDFLKASDMNDIGKFIKAE